MKRDRNDPAYVNELWRRWERRRMLPFRRFDAAVEELLTALSPPVEWLAVRLNREAARPDWRGKVVRLLTR